jgi:hypothetical protein
MVWSCRNNADNKDIEGHQNYSLKEIDHWDDTDNTRGKSGGKNKQKGNILRKREEIGEFSSFDPYKMERMPEERDY